MVELYLNCAKNISVAGTGMEVRDHVAAFHNWLRSGEVVLRITGPSLSTACLICRFGDTENRLFPDQEADDKVLSSFSSLLKWDNS